MPHLARDPVIAAAAIVHALQPLVSRETDPLDGAVISVTRLSTGKWKAPFCMSALQGECRGLAKAERRAHALLGHVQHPCHMA